jgi:arylsulfatase
MPFGAPISAETLTGLDAHHWELYHIANDPAENHDLPTSTGTSSSS